MRAKSLFDDHQLAILHPYLRDEGRQLELLAILWFGKFGLQSGIDPRDRHVEIANFEESRLQTDVSILAAELASESYVDVDTIARHDKLTDYLVAQHSNLHR